MNTPVSRTTHATRAHNATYNTAAYKTTQGYFVPHIYQQVGFTILRNPRLSPRCVLIWQTLSSWANGNPAGFYVEVAARYLLEKFDCSDTTLKESLNRLQDEGYLIIYTTTKYWRRHYHLTPIFPNGDDGEEGDNDSTGSHRRDHTKPLEKPRPTQEKSIANPLEKSVDTPRKTEGINIIKTLNKKITLTLPPKKREELADGQVQGDQTAQSPISRTPDTPSPEVYLTYEGEVLSPEELPPAPSPALPAKPVELGSLFDQQPTKADFEHVKAIMIKADTLPKEDRENYLAEPLHQKLLCHMAGWAVNQKVLPVLPVSYENCLRVLKMDFYMPTVGRRWVKYGAHESEAAWEQYQQALEKAQRTTTAPALPASVAVSLPRSWITRIQNFIRNLKYASPKALLLEIAYHIQHFKPTQIRWKTEAERFDVNFSLAIRLLRDKLWCTPKGLMSLVTRYQELKGS